MTVLETPAENHKGCGGVAGKKKTLDEENECRN